MKNGENQDTGNALRRSIDLMIEVDYVNLRSALMQQVFRTPFEIRIIQGAEVTLKIVNESKAAFREWGITDDTMSGSTETEITMAAYPTASETTVGAMFDAFLG